MRKIEQEMVRAVRAFKPFTKDNTEVKIASITWFTPVARVYLHRNLIATYDEYSGLKFSMAGWPTVTTRSRLNALMEAFIPRAFGVGQHQHRQYVRDAGGWLPIDEREWYGFNSETGRFGPVDDPA